MCRDGASVTSRKAKDRLPAVTVPITIGAREGNAGHRLTVSFAYDPETTLLREVVFVGRGKSGHGLDDMLKELGIKLSRAIQGRDPETGKELPT